MQIIHFLKKTEKMSLSNSPRSSRKILQVRLRLSVERAIRVQEILEKKNLKPKGELEEGRQKV